MTILEFLLIKCGLLEFNFYFCVKEMSKPLLYNNGYYDDDSDYPQLDDEFVPPISLKLEDELQEQSPKVKLKLVLVIFDFFKFKLNFVNMLKSSRPSSMKLVEPIDLDSFETKNDAKNNKKKSSTATVAATDGWCKCTNIWTTMLAIILFAALVALAIFIGVTYASITLLQYQNKPYFKIF